MANRINTRRPRNPSDLDRFPLSHHLPRGIVGNNFLKILSTVFEHNNYVYKFVFPEDDKRNWHEAERLCKTAENGHLTSLVSPGEIIWVDSVIRNAVQRAGSNVKLWIGGSDRKIIDVWDFVDGQPLRYNVVPWAPGQPKRPQGNENDVYCISLEFGGGRSIWRVDDCYEAHGYICKADGRSSSISKFHFYIIRCKS